MAKLRRNHQETKKGLSGFYPKFTILAGVLILIVALFSKRILPDFTTIQSWEEGWQILDIDEYDSLSTFEKGFLPYAAYGEVVIDPRYSLAYSEAHEQAIWVAYELTKERLNRRNATRNNWFEEDKRITTGSALHADYIRSGYTRGHLAPAEDFAYDQEAMDHTFLMSNISPQLSGFNGGIWRELEELIRDWTRHNDRLIITTGPVFFEGQEIEYIGKNKVAVPHAFYKVILDIDLPEQKGIGFVIPHAVSDQPLSQYATTIRFVEELTNIDFFMDYIPQPLQDSIENNFDINQWAFSDRKFRLRVTKWNKD